MEPKIDTAAVTPLLTLAQAAERLAAHGVSQPRVDRSTPDGRARPERRAAVLGGGPRRLDAWAAALPRRRRSARGEDVTERNSILRLAPVSTSSRTPKCLELSAQENVWQTKQRA
jgi:hypothetical protein